MKGHLEELDKETLKALEMLYNFSQSSPRERREAGSESKYLKEFPLLKIEDLQQKMAMDLGTGHRRRIEASIVPGDSSILNVNNPHDIVGFRLVSPTGRTFCGCPPWCANVTAARVSPQFSGVHWVGVGRSHVFDTGVHLDHGVAGSPSLKQVAWLS